jgi:hypothetical protein
MSDCDGYCGWGCLQPNDDCKCGPAKNKKPSPPAQLKNIQIVMVIVVWDVFIQSHANVIKGQPTNGLFILMILI